MGWFIARFVGLGDPDAARIKALLHVLLEIIFSLKLNGTCDIK